MKIIELYTKLANKEIIPRYIKVCERKYEFDESDNEYYPRNENDNDTLLERISRGNVLAWLNTEFQELNSLEEKKIPEELNKLFYREDYATQNACIDDIIRQFNNLIDYIKSKGE